jgi:prepilin-type N-terminal cleavage/methylation domain-containing protein
MTRRRSGFSLPEVMVASFVLAVVLLPVLFMFLTSTGGAGQDVRELKATLMAQELLEQVVGVQRVLTELFPVPADNENGTKEMDVEKWLESHPNEEGAPLYVGKCSPRVTRMFVTKPTKGFTRFLSISPEKVGKDRGSVMSTPVLWKVTARVRYVTPTAAREIGKDVTLTTFLYMDSAPPGDDEEIL